jgi:hypothetical protein
MLILWRSSRCRPATVQRKAPGNRPKEPNFALTFNDWTSLRILDIPVNCYLKPRQSRTLFLISQVQPQVQANIPFTDVVSSVSCLLSHSLQTCRPQSCFLWINPTRCISHCFDYLKHLNIHLISWITLYLVPPNTATLLRHLMSYIYRLTSCPFIIV